MLSCSPDWYSDSAGDRSYNLYLFSLGFVLPLGIIISTSAAALRAVKNVSKFYFILFFILFYEKHKISQGTPKKNYQKKVIFPTFFKLLRMG